jgi:hypothetical protein
MNTDTNTPNGSSETPHHRRSREEVEALAKNFVATPVEEVVPPKPRARIAMAAGGAVAVVAILAVVFWPRGRSEAERAQADSTRAAAAADAEQWKQRFEAERERKRQELASGKEYLERMAAADAALMKDIGEQASRLAERAAAQPAPADTPPTPKATTAKAAPAPAPSQPTTATQTASAAPAKPAPAPAAQPEPAKAAPAPAASATQEVAQADKASCSIHVSELTKSGKLTYADVKRMKGARIDEESGHVYLPPVQAANGRSVVFEVFPNGCVSVKRG